MQLPNFLAHVVRPALSLLSDLAGRPMGGPEAEVLMLAIALQESGAEHRAQIRGPARSYWQFEFNGGFKGVLRHDRTGVIASKLIDELNLPGDSDELWQTFPQNDLLAAGFARLLIFSDNAALPALRDQRGAWAYYLRNWRPGKPRPDAWPAHYQQALELVLSTMAMKPAPAVDPRIAAWRAQVDAAIVQLQGVCR